ncbi:MAG: tetratricopeptide repeat protein [Sphingomonadaceae bacterium]
MTKLLTRAPALLLVATCLMVGAPSAFAQSTASEATIDALIDQSGDGAAALATADAQVSAGDLSGAATTLERLLINDPDATPVRLRYAALLCDLDDRQAARFELSKLASETIDAAGWSRVESACGPTPKPTK